MKIPFNRTVIVIFEILSSIAVIFLAAWLFDDNTLIFDDARGSYRNNICWRHDAFNIITVILMAYHLVILIGELMAVTDDDCRAPYEKYLKSKGFDTSYNKEKKKKSSYSSYSDNDDKDDTPKCKKHIEINESILNKINFKNMKLSGIKIGNVNLKKMIWIGVALFLVVAIYKKGRVVADDAIVLYNTSQEYQNNYQQKMEERMGYYDKLWKTFYQKDQIANLNYENFREITIIIMENRKGGDQLLMQWLTENQQIPYEEMTKFYTDLSNFIREQREGYFMLEKQCQVIAKVNNTMLDTFPNNIYNRVLKLEHIEFEYGFLSDKTNKTFETGIENLD